jgi:hypothetical protein
MTPFQNWEDFIDNNDKGDYGIKKEWPLWRKIVAWNLIRNPAQGLRWMPILSCKIDPKRVRWMGSPHTNPMLYDMKPAKPECFYAYQGPYASLWWQYESIITKKIVRLWIGWAIYPSDQHGVTPYRKDGAGFKIQWKNL